MKRQIGWKYLFITFGLRFKPDTKDTPVIGSTVYCFSFVSGAFTGVIEHVVAPISHHQPDKSQFRSPDKTNETARNSLTPLFSFNEKATVCHSGVRDVGAD